jgi:hypothetical protein
MFSTLSKLIRLFKEIIGRQAGFPPERRGKDPILAWMMKFFAEFILRNFEILRFTQDDGSKTLLERQESLRTRFLCCVSVRGAVAASAAECLDQGCGISIVRVNQRFQCL